MAIKGRLNGEPEEFEPKYLYIENGPMSQTLFGYSENYSSLYENEILIVESEKSVLKLDSWGYNNVVALGSNSLSTTQAKLLIYLFLINLVHNIFDVVEKFIASLGFF